MLAVHNHSPCSVQSVFSYLEIPFQLFIHLSTFIYSKFISVFIVNERKKNKITKVTKLLQKSRDKTNPFSMKPSDNIIITYGRPTL